MITNGHFVVWQSVFVPLAAGKFWFVFVPNALDRDVTNKITCVPKCFSNYIFNWC